MLMVSLGDSLFLLPTERPHRQVLQFAVSACLVLLVDVLENPHSLNVQVDIKLLKSVLRWIVRLKDVEGYDLVNLHTALSATVRIAESAVNGYGNVLQSAVDQSPAPAHAELMVLRACPCVLMEIQLIRSRSWRH